MTRIDPALQAHKDWIGFVKPVGLVVSPRALIDAQAQIDVRAAMGPQQILLAMTAEDHIRVADFHRFTTDVLRWRECDLVSGTELEPLAVVLPEFGDTLAPTYAVRDAENADRWQILVIETAPTDDLDNEDTNILRGWTASHQARFERLLRERDIPIGILTNREVVRLVYAPRGESTGHVTFVVREMTEVLGRPILAALLMLLGEQRLFAEASNRNLAALLRQSRKYQNEVSERLAEQVLESLWRLLYGFQAADEFSRGDLLRDVLRRSPNDIYGGLLATIMRMVFTLYAEDRALLPVDSKIYAENYGLLGLFERLREDNARYPDTMTQRFGAWAQLLTLFRLLHDGASHGDFKLPPRHGRLFDPYAYPFLEGRNSASHDGFVANNTVADQQNAATIPRISDAIVYGILDKLLYLDGDRLSYAALDVEEIGSVYEAMMGFRVEVTSGRSIGVKPKTKKGVRADVIVNLEKLLAAKSPERAKLLKEEAGAEVTGKSLEALKSALTPEQIVDALGNRVSPFTPRILPKGAMALQPSEERRRSGSHYTPRSLTQPIVKTTLQPILDQLCGDPECAAFNARMTRSAASQCPDASPPKASNVDINTRGPNRSSTSRSVIRRWAPVRSSSKPAGFSAKRSCGRGRSTAAYRRFRPTKTSFSTHAGGSHSNVCTAWIETPSRSISRSCRSGWQLLPGIIRLPSWITRCATVTRSSVCRAIRSSISTGKTPTSWCWSSRMR